LCFDLGVHRKRCVRANCPNPVRRALFAGLAVVGRFQLDLDWLLRPDKYWIAHFEQRIDINQHELSRRQRLRAFASPNEN
jgi:hypothetical protein